MIERAPTLPVGTDGLGIDVRLVGRHSQLASKVTVQGKQPRRVSSKFDEEVTRREVVDDRRGSGEIPSPPPDAGYPNNEGAWAVLDDRRAGPARVVGRWGFTLPEILIVVVLFGLLVMIVSPRVAAQAKRARAETAAQQLLADLERSRGEAVKRSVGITLRVTGSDSYTIDSIGDRALSGITFSSAPDSVRFAPLGPPLTGAATFVIMAGDYDKTLTLNSAGYASVE